MIVNEDPGFAAMRARAVAAERQVARLLPALGRAIDAIDPMTPALTMRQRDELVRDLRSAAAVETARTPLAPASAGAVRSAASANGPAALRTPRARTTRGHLMAVSDPTGVVVDVTDTDGRANDVDLNPTGPNFAGLPSDDLHMWWCVRQHGPGRVRVSPALADRLVRVLGVATPVAA